ncbi:hypothetical protein Peur_068489 [Populus x canadensis]
MNPSGPGEEGKLSHCPSSRIGPEACIEMVTKQNSIFRRDVTGNHRGVNVVMETKGGKKKSSSSSSSNSVQYEVPLGYSIEDVRPNGGIEKFRSAAYSNVLREDAILIRSENKNIWHLQ